MIPKRIVLKNFMSHRETDIDCTQFDSCLIVGRKKNNDRESNAVGKSTIFTAIDWVLFNKYPGAKLEKIVRDDEDSCEVIYEFEQDNIDWKITRKRSNKSGKSHVLLEQWIDGKWDRQDRRTSSQTEDALKDILKITHTAFVNSVRFEQGKFSAIAEATDAERRKLLKEPLSLAVYGKYEKRAKASLKEFSDQLSEKKTLIVDLGNPDVDIINLDKVLYCLNKEIIILENKRKDICNVIKSDNARLTELEKLLSSDAAKVSDQLVENDRQRQRIISTISRMQQQAAKYKSDIESSNAEYQSNSKKLDSANIAKEKLDSKIVRNDTDVKKDLEDLYNKEQKGNVYIANLQVDFEKFNKPLPPGAECDYCFNELTDEYRNKVSSDNEIKSKKIKKDLDAAISKMQKLLIKKKKLNEERNDIIQHNQALQQIELKIFGLKSQIKQNREHLQTVEKLAIHLFSDVEEENKKLEDLLTQEIYLKQKSKDFDIVEINDEIVNIKNRLRINEINDNNVISQLSASSTQKGITEERRRKREEDSQKLVILKEDYDQLESKVKLWSRVVKAFSNSGIPTLIIHTILDDLQVEANQILQDLRPELSLQFFVEKNDKDALGLTYKVNGKEREYIFLSGGQRAFVSFALRLGLSLVIQKRIGVNIRMLELDEVDQPMDAAGQDAYVEAIRKYHKKFKIFIITHNDRLKDKFKHYIMVENDEPNGSTGKLMVS